MLFTLSWPNSLHLSAIKLNRGSTAPKPIIYFWSAPPGGKDLCGAQHMMWGNRSIKSFPKSYCRRRRWVALWFDVKELLWAVSSRTQKRNFQTHILQQPPPPLLCLYSLPKTLLQKSIEIKHFKKMPFTAAAAFNVIIDFSTARNGSWNASVTFEEDINGNGLHNGCHLLWQWCSRDILKSHKIIIKFFSAELFSRKKKGAENRPINDNRLLVFHQ